MYQPYRKIYHLWFICDSLARCINFWIKGIIEYWQSLTWCNILFDRNINMWTWLMFKRFNVHVCIQIFTKWWLIIPSYDSTSFKDKDVYIPLYYLISNNMKVLNTKSVCLRIKQKHTLYIETTCADYYYKHC